MMSDHFVALEKAPWPVFLVDRAGRIHAASAGAREFFGSIPLVELNLAALLWPPQLPDSAPFAASLTEPGHEARRVFLQGADGQPRSFQLHSCPLPAGPAGDEAMQLLQFFPEPDLAGAPAAPAKARPESPPVIEASLAQKQKLDCAMQLIRTVALDFNNALTGIMGHSSLLLGKIDARHPLRGSLVEIEKSAQRAAEIASDLAAFSRPEKDTRAQTSGNLNDVVRRTVEFLQETSAPAISWKVETQKSLFTAQFDEAKIQQALVKVLENAVQAIEQAGTITLTTRNLELAQAWQDAGATLAPGAYVAIEIEDTGHGIAPEIMPRIFDPFFTTKKGGGHRGLGLAWVYGIITNHGGAVAVSNRPDHLPGTSARLYLPAQRKVVQDHAQNPAGLTGTETILMIDDEDLVLTMADVVLTSFGYRVFTASNGVRALEIFAEKSGEIDLVITDLVMPQMSGREVIDHLRQLAPDLNILCASGFVRSPTELGHENYLQKPFASQDLLRKVKDILSAEGNKA